MRAEFPHPFRSSSIRFVLLPVLTVGLFAQCAFFGLAGPLLISEKEEVRLGSEFDRHLRTDPEARKEFPVFVANTPEKRAFEKYFTELAESTLALVPKGERPGYEFTFTLIDQDINNAFAVPGGYVYFYTGIIRSMQDESELVGVIGHEIAHVTRHHYRDALAKQAGMGLLLQALLGDDAGAVRQLVAQVFFSLAALSVSRDNESDADRYGTRYTANMGRNPLGIAKYFERVQNPGPEWLSTHPAPKNRVERVKAQVRNSERMAALAADSARTNNREHFMRMTAAIR